MASAVALVLTPIPPTISAMRGASGLPGIGCCGRAKASAGRVPSAAIFGTAPCGVISRNFGSTDAAAGIAPGVALAVAAAVVGDGTTTSCLAPVLPSMMVTVVLSAGTAGAGGAAAAAGGAVVAAATVS